MSTNYHLVEDEEQNYWKGVFLGKRAGGWVPQLKWHRENFCSCDCPDGTHNYRNWDEFQEFVLRGVVKNEYGDVIDSAEFIFMLEEWKENNDMEPDDRSRTWQIDGWWFVKGDWC